MEDTPEIQMPCPHCSRDFKFPRAGVGQTARCPHCGMELLLESDQAQESPSFDEPANIQKKRVITYDGGMEKALDFIGAIFIILGLVSGLGIIIYDFSNDGSHGLPFAVGAGCIVSGLALGFPFKALAEIIRLLKKQNGLKFSGNITEPKPFKHFECAACGKETLSASTKCNACGAVFEK